MPREKAKSPLRVRAGRVCLDRGARFLGGLSAGRHGVPGFEFLTEADVADLLTSLGPAAVQAILEAKATPRNWRIAQGVLRDPPVWDSQEGCYLL